MNNKVALIVGATGGVGSETARALLAAGWKVRAVTRDVARAERTSSVTGIEWVAGDAMSPEQVTAAARGVSVVVHAVNPPGYRNWKGLALPMLESSIAAARSAGARIVFPGTVYNFGPDTGGLVDEQAPQNPTTRKGKIRVAMERRLRAAAEQGTPVLIVRAGDFFGPRAANSWFSQGMIRPGRPLRSVMYPGKHDASHAWAYLPDLARTIVELLERDRDLRAFEVFHFGGHGFERGVELAEATAQVAGLERRHVRRFPWFVVYLLAPFVTTFREMLEMRYLWSRSLLLDNRKLVDFLGREPHTPLAQALHETLVGQRTLPQQGASSTVPHGA